MAPLGTAVAPGDRRWRSEGRLNVWLKEQVKICSKLSSYNFLVPFELPTSYSPKKLQIEKDQNFLALSVSCYWNGFAAAFFLRNT